jgi:hypothetical protein
MRQQTLDAGSTRGMTGNAIALSPSRIARILAGTACLLIVLSMVGQTIAYVTGHDSLLGLVQLFDLDNEHNIPSFFSASDLLFASVLLAIIAVRKRHDRDPFSRHWGILSVVFVYLALDEAAALHESLSKPVRLLLGTHVGGALFFTWVVPYLVGTLLVALAYRRFLFALPARTRLLFILAALLLVGGALGMEMVEGPYAAVHGVRNLGMTVFSTIEESLEMAGVVVFNYALLTYIEAHCADVHFQIGTASRPSMAVASSYGHRPVPGGEQVTVPSRPRWRVRATFQTILNGTDVPARPTGRPFPTDAPLTVRHLGTLYGLRSVLPVLTAIRDADASAPPSAERVCVELIGPIEANTDRAAQAASEMGITLTGIPPLPYSEAVTLMTTPSMLLVVQSGDFGASIPTKLFEYLRSGNPVLVLAAKSSTLWQLSSRYPRCHRLDFDDAEHNRRVMKELITSWRRGELFQVATDQDTADLSKAAVGEEYVSLLRKVLGRA